MCRSTTTQDASITASAEAASDAGGNGPSAEVAVALPLAEVADLRRDTATDQIAAMLTALPPRPITSDKSEAATSEVATALVAEPPAPPPPPQATSREPHSRRWQPRWPPHTLHRRLSPSMHQRQRQRQRSPRWLVPRHPCRVGNPQYRCPNRNRWFVRPSPKPLPPSRNWPNRTSPPQSKTQARKRPSSLAAALGLGRRWRWPRRTSLSSRCPRLGANNAAYGSQVWAALARHKPRAGVRGSTTVVFSIGENGGLRGVQVGRSSGNARIDQLALQTVRSAAPYPPPPAGVATYTIRIDFQ